MVEFGQIIGQFNRSQGPGKICLNVFITGMKVGRLHGKMSEMAGEGDKIPEEHHQAEVLKIIPAAAMKG